MTGRADREAHRAETAIGGTDSASAARDLSAAAADLSRIAKRHGFDTLSYLFDMAQMEARQLVNSSGIQPPG